MGRKCVWCLELSRRSSVVHVMACGASAAAVWMARRWIRIHKNLSSGEKLLLCMHYFFMVVPSTAIRLACLFVVFYGTLHGSKSV